MSIYYGRFYNPYHHYYYGRYLNQFIPHLQSYPVYPSIYPPLQPGYYTDIHNHTIGTQYGSCDCSAKTGGIIQSNCNISKGYYPVCTGRNCTCHHISGDFGCFNNKHSDC